MKTRIYQALLLSAVLLLPAALPSCDDDDDFELRDTIELDAALTSLSRPATADTIKVTFRAGNKPHYSFTPKTCDWATVTDNGVYAGLVEATVLLKPNETEEGREVTLNIACGTAQQQVKIAQAGAVKDDVPLKKEDIPNFEKYIDGKDAPNAVSFDLSGAYSWKHMKQSDHFFLFWNKYFGDDPGKVVDSTYMNETVDIDDLLKKAEQFYKTNIEKLKMATVGEGKSYLDDYKMQIFLMDPTNVEDRWQATGSGYQDKIGALWITPSTCQPVGSVIAHEIGHSFQYQTYADKLKQGAKNDKKHGFRYGFEGPAGEGNGDCAYWEQCAQWQSFQDYPEVAFVDNYEVWLANCHRHFHHEWQRYASFWLQYYWVKKHDVECYGKLWTESAFPEDAIDAYTRLYCGGSYATCREELADYALRMATFDIEGIDQTTAKKHFDEYRTKLYPVDNDYLQIGYGQCPGNTGFNVIALTVPTSGDVTIDFEGVDYGSSLPEGDNGAMYDGDGKLVGAATKYNKVLNVKASDIGWRFGLVAFDGSSKRTYSDIGKANGDSKTAQLTFAVPAGTQQLYLVVQGSTEKYFGHGWDERESNDVQCPYKVKLTNCQQKHNQYAASPKPSYNKVSDTVMNATLSYSVPADAKDFKLDNIDLSSHEVMDFLGLKFKELSEAMLQAGAFPAEGKVACQLRDPDFAGEYLPCQESDGTYFVKDGLSSTYNDGGQTYFKIAGAAIEYGWHKESCAAGKTYVLRPTLIYKTADDTKYIHYTLNITVP